MKLSTTLPFFLLYTTSTWPLLKCTSHLRAATSKLFATSSHSVRPPGDGRIPASCWNHIKLSHTLWGEVVNKGDIVVDATCGNGHDSVILADMALTRTSGTLVCMDIQEQALEKTRQAISAIDPALLDRTLIVNRNHRTFPEMLGPNSVSLVVYNLGYLPGSDKSIVTNKENTIISIRAALSLLKPRGLLSVLCYRMHCDEAMLEASAVEDELRTLPPERWRTFSHTPLNWPRAPLLVTAYRLK